MIKIHKILSLFALGLMASGCAEGSNIIASKFNSTLKATNQNDEIHQHCVDALEQIDLNIDLNNVVTDIRLPSIGLYKTTFSWSSSNDSVVKASSISDGIAKVTRGSEDVDVILTATASINKDAATAATKEFKLTILKTDNNGTASDLPLSYSEDFSEYETGLELSNYYKWQLVKGEGGNARAVDESLNYNNLVSSKALEITSERTATDMTYQTKINVKAGDLDADGVAVVEGFFMFYGETNGVSLELVSANGTVSKFGISSVGYTYVNAGNTKISTVLKPTEGVWEKFRVEFMPAKGRYVYQIFDWTNAKYVDVTKSDPDYLVGKGVPAGSSGNVEGLNITLSKGSLFGKTYLSSLKIDKKANMAYTESEISTNNPNRSKGIGSITGYDSEILTYKGSDYSAQVNPDFVVHNRFNDGEVFTKNTDYSITSSHENGSDENTIIYSHKFLLISTGEFKTIKQTVYLDTDSNTASIYNLKVSYLKAATTIDASTGKSIVVPGKGLITISGNVIRSDSTLHYLIVSKGSTTPTNSAVLNQDSTTEGYITGGSLEVKKRAFSLDTDQINYPNEYDVYVITQNSYGNSSLYTSSDISTQINLSTPEDLHEMSSDLTVQGSTFKLINDIDCKNYFWEFDPTSRSFTGLIEGQGHKISNLTISNSAIDSTIKTGMFFNFNGTIKNVLFENIKVTGLTDVGILGGNAYGCSVENVSFLNCTVKQDESVSGGDGYFATAIGRCRSSVNSFMNITMKNSLIDCPQRSGLLVAGITDGTVLNIENIAAQGSISVDGAHAGLVGRNQGGTLNVKNAYIDLDVLNAKKEVGGVLGRNENNGKVKAENVISDLRIGEMTQPTYFGQFIGYDAPTTGNAGKTFAYTGTNVFYINEDYSNLGDSIVPIKNSITLGKGLDEQGTYTQEWWEKNTFIKDFDTSLIWGYSESEGKPFIEIKNASDLSLVAADFEKWADQIDTSDIQGSYYYIYKADDIYSLLNDTEKGKISSETLKKFTDAKAEYIKIYKDVNDISDLLQDLI
jgi:hypothetical protein